MRTALFVMCTLFCSSFSGFAQLPDISGLTVGDKLPDQYFKQLKDMVSHEKDLYILDFWSTSCKSCIELMPKVDSLQQQFNNRIEIIYVSKEHNKIVDHLFSRLKKLRKPGNQFINGDSVFSYLFPYITVPHHVWINKEGRVLYITEWYNLTQENILATLKGQKLPLRLKEEFEDLDWSGPLLLEGNGRLLKYVHTYSVLMNRISSFSGGLSSFIKDSVKNTISAKFINIPLLSLYQFAYSKAYVGVYHEDTRIIIAVNNREPFVYPLHTTENEYWFDKFLKCYELRTELSHQDRFFSIMQQDLEKYFPYKAQIEKQKRNVIVIRAADKGINLKSKSKEPKELNSDNEILIQNKKFYTLVSIIKKIFKEYIVIDETNYKEKIDLSLSGNIQNINFLKSALLKHGVALSVEQKEIEILVIRDK